MTNGPIKPVKQKFPFYKIVKPLYYIGLAVFIWVLGQFTPGVPDELVGEIGLVVLIAGTEIYNKVKASKEKKSTDSQ